MWIRQVTAQAFGPFKGDSLDLASGLTVVTGTNEAGKSSWHAATYAGLCGMRRGKGRRLKDDEQFAARHQPWDGGPWEVSAVVVLADGRTIELRHDLAGQVSNSARDLDLGRDVTAEIIHDGAPDGSVWLGLDRRAFAAVACVRQAEILSVTQHADAIQQHLQRAAATAGADETAATALAALADYQREHVGLERANSSKPLMVAIRGVDTARARHDDAVAAHADWLEREAGVAKLEHLAGVAANRLRAAKAVRARQAAEQLNARVRTMAELAAAHPHEPSAAGSDDDLAARVATAVHAWNQRPNPQPLEGRSVDELRTLLAEVPPMPHGDLDPHASVVAARRALADVLSRAEAHQHTAPAEAPVPHTGGATDGELVDLARELSTAIPSVDSSLVAEAERLRTDAAQRSAAAARRPLLVPAAVVAGVFMLAGLGLIVAGSVLPGAGALALASVAGVVAAVQAMGARSSTDDGGVELRAVEARLVMAEQLAADAERRRQQAEHRVHELGLSPDPAALRQIANQLQRAEHSAAVRQQWELANRQLSADLAAASSALADALSDRTVDVTADLHEPRALLATVDQYEHACRQRRSVAEAAHQGSRLDAELQARERDEVRFAADTARLGQCRRELYAVAVEVGVVADHELEAVAPDDLVDRLDQWARDRQRRRDELDAAWRGWHQLQAQLDGRSLDDWRAEATRYGDAAAMLADGVPAATLAAVDLGSDPDGTIRRLDHEASQHQVALAEARRELSVRAESIVPVAEAAEELAGAIVELDRVRRLDDTLSITQRFMAEAQQRVHRDIAPVLAAKVQERLSIVTGGRYSEVTVDPETLGVHVRDPHGRWRDAGYLSQGTAEQVFLLLRVAMAEILTTDSCPLLLDDVTVQSDSVRTRALLEVLHQVSADHQVVLFSQEDEVVAWAEAHLGERDRLVTLA